MFRADPQFHYLEEGKCFISVNPSNHKEFGLFETDTKTCLKRYSVDHPIHGLAWCRDVEDTLVFVAYEYENISVIHASGNILNQFTSETLHTFACAIGLDNKQQLRLVTVSFDKKDFRPDPQNPYFDLNKTCYETITSIPLHQPASGCSFEYESLAGNILNPGSDPQIKLYRGRSLLFLANARRSQIDMIDLDHPKLKILKTTKRHTNYANFKLHVNQQGDLLLIIYTSRTFEVNNITRGSEHIFILSPREHSSSAMTSVCENKHGELFILVSSRDYANVYKLNGLTSTAQLLLHTPLSGILKVFIDSAGKPAVLPPLSMKDLDFKTVPSLESLCLNYIGTHPKVLTDPRFKKDLPEALREKLCETHQTSLVFCPCQKPIGTAPRLLESRAGLPEPATLSRR